MDAESTVLKQKVGADEVAIAISGAEEASTMKKENTVLELAAPSNSSAPSQTPKPKSGTGFLRTSPRARSLGSRHKSRLVEAPLPQKMKVVQERSIEDQAPTASSPYQHGRTKTLGSAAPNTPTGEQDRKDQDDDDDDDDDDLYKASTHPEYLAERKKHSKKVKFLILMEWIIFFCIITILIGSLCIKVLKNQYLCGLHIWKWCLLVVVVFCGHLVTEWLVEVLHFFIERNFLFKKRVLYFLYALRSSFRVSLWLGLILLTWVLLIKRGVKRTRINDRVLNYITRAIACCLIGACLWMLETLLIKLLACSFHRKKFFDRIQESLFHQYVLHTLSSSPLLRNDGTSSKTVSLSLKQPKKLSRKQKGSSGEEVIDVHKLTKIKKEKVSAWTMGGLVEVISTSDLSTISEVLEDCEESAQKDIRSESEAKAVAKHIFKKVAKPGNEHIEVDDLEQFMPREEVELLLVMFEGAAETGRIKKSDFKNWLVKAYQERKHLAYSLNDAKTAIEELNKITLSVAVALIIIISLLLLRIATTQVLVFISSQLILVAFMFGNTAKTVFEGIVFVFVTHPFDIGDKCVIDGVQMVVEEMKILTTIFLRYDNEKIYYPNSVLATKPIGNFNRSPEMADTIDFAVDFSTSVESIAAFKTRIKEYLESKPQHWRSHGVSIKEIENMNKLNMALSVTHTVNFQSPETGSRRSDLVLEMKRIFEDLDIKYHLLPQEVHLRYV